MKTRELNNGTLSEAEGRAAIVRLLEQHHPRYHACARIGLTRQKCETLSEWDASPEPVVRSCCSPPAATAR